MNEKYLFGGESLVGTSRAAIPEGFTKETAADEARPAPFDFLYPPTTSFGGFLGRPENGEERN